MPLMDYSGNWTTTDIEADITWAMSKAKGDISKVPGLLNSKGWSVNNFDVRDYISSKHPDIYAAWQSKFGSLFKTNPLIVGGVIILFGIGFLLWKDKKPKERTPF